MHFWRPTSHFQWSISSCQNLSIFTLWNPRPISFMPALYSRVQKGREKDRNAPDPPLYSSFYVTFQLLNYAKISLDFSASHWPFYLANLLNFTRKLVCLPGRSSLTFILHYVPLLCALIRVCTFSFISLITHYCNYLFHFLSSPLDHNLHEGRSHVDLVHNYISISNTVPRMYQPLNK